MFIHQNLKILRKRKGLTQSEAATRIGLSRSQLAGYEAHIKPTLEALILISDFFGIGTDAILRMNFSETPELKIRELEEGKARFQEEYLQGKKLRVLAITVDSQGKELTEWVPAKAKAGYLNGYSDPEFIGELPKTHFPILNQGRKHRVFQLEGDSMPPHSPGSYVVGSYMEDWYKIKNGHKYLILTENEGMVFKIAYQEFMESGSLLLCSSNPAYPPFRVKGEDILEIWTYEWSIHP